MSPEEVEKSKRLSSIINPESVKRYIKLGEKKRMVHYTSAENAFKILYSKTLWLRNTNTMVDYSEVEHGHQLLAQFFR